MFGTLALWTSGSKLALSGGLYSIAGLYATPLNAASRPGGAHSAGRGGVGAVASG